jgi:hypothetical protein
VVSRYFRVKDDKKTIATWKLYLDSIHQIFTVRSVVSVTTGANFPVQKELTIDSSVTVSTTGHNVANTHNVVSHTSKDPEDTRGEYQMVRTVRTLVVTE